MEAKIADKSAVIAVVGLGYVGLPLAVAFAQVGFKVIGIDTDTGKVKAVNKGASYIGDVDSDTLAPLVQSGLIEATSNIARLQCADAILVCVPTPLTKARQSDLSYVKSVSKDIAANLQPGQLIVLESTVYPGTTREIVLPILEQSGLKAGVDFYLAFSPERVDPGSKKFNLSNTPKVIGGVGFIAAHNAFLLYSQITGKIILTSSPEAAEMTKVYENTFRMVNIALVNELAQLCHLMGVSVWEVIEAASTKPFGFMPFRPGPGVGGHCIPLDPYYLSDRAREFDFHTRFIELAGEVNEQMPYYTVTRIMEALNARDKCIKGAKVLVLGASYKKDVGDTRESPSLKLIELLASKGTAVTYNDPYVPEVRAKDCALKSEVITQEGVAGKDCVVIATDHSAYDYAQIVEWSKLVFDARGATGRLRSPNIVRLGE